MISTMERWRSEQSNMHRSGGLAECFLLFRTPPALSNPVEICRQMNCVLQMSRAHLCICDNHHRASLELRDVCCSHSDTKGGRGAHEAVRFRCTTVSLFSHFFCPSHHMLFSMWFWFFVIFSSSPPPPSRWQSPYFLGGPLQFTCSS